MSKKNQSLKIYENYYIYILFIFPILLVSGPFLPDLWVSISIIIFFLSKNYFDFNYKRNYLISFLFIFYFLILISSVLSEYFYKSILTSLPYIRFIIFAIMIKILLSKKNILNKKLYFFYVISITFICLDAWLQYFTGKNIFLMNQTVPNRISGLFGDELILGSFLSKIYPLILLVYFLNQTILKKRDEIIFLFFTFLVLITVFISGERAALNHLIIFIFIILTLVFKFNIKNFSYLIVGIFIFLLIIFFNKNTFERQIISQIKSFDTKKVFTVYHIQHFKSAYAIFLDNKFFGTGVKTFRFECNKEKYRESEKLRSHNIKSCSSHPHNTYLQLLSESGFYSFVCIFSLFIFFSIKLLYYTFLKIKKKLNNKHYPEIVISAFMFFYLFPISTNGSFFNNWLNCIFFLYLGTYFFLREKNDNLKKM